MILPILWIEKKVFEIIEKRKRELELETLLEALNGLQDNRDKLPKNLNTFIRIRNPQQSKEEKNKKRNIKKRAKKKAKEEQKAKDAAALASANDVAIASRKDTAATLSVALTAIPQKNEHEKKDDKELTEAKEKREAALQPKYNLLMLRDRLLKLNRYLLNAKTTSRDLERIYSCIDIDASLQQSAIEDCLMMIFEAHSFYRDISLNAHSYIKFEFDETMLATGKLPFIPQIDSILINSRRFRRDLAHLDIEISPGIYKEFFAYHKQLVGYFEAYSNAFRDIKDKLDKELDNRLKDFDELSSMQTTLDSASHLSASASVLSFTNKIRVETSLISAPQASTMFQTNFSSPRPSPLGGGVEVLSELASSPASGVEAFVSHSGFNKSVSMDQIALSGSASPEGIALANSQVPFSQESTTIYESPLKPLTPQFKAEKERKEELESAGLASSRTTTASSKRVNVNRKDSPV